MNIQFLALAIQRILKGNLVITLFLCGYLSTSAEDKDQEVLNQLYNEIVNNGSAPGLDSMGKSVLSSPDILKNDLPNTTPGDPVAEQLKREIEKIVKETQVRHGDAVKFMQDAK